MVSTSVPSATSRVSPWKRRTTLQGAAVEADHALKDTFRGLVEASLLLSRVVAQDARAHHRRQGQRDHGGDDDGDGQGHGELAEQAADDIAHEEQRE